MPHDTLPAPAPVDIVYGCTACRDMGCGLCMDLARAELEAEWGAEADYLREAYGPSAVDLADDPAAAEWEERLYWESPTRNTCAPKVGVYGMGTCTCLDEVGEDDIPF